MECFDYLSNGHFQSVLLLSSRCLGRGDGWMHKSFVPFCEQCFLSLVVLHTTNGLVISRRRMKLFFCPQVVGLRFVSGQPSPRPLHGRARGKRLLMMTLWRGSKHAPIHIQRSLVSSLGRAHLFKASICNLHIYI